MGTNILAWFKVIGIVGILTLLAFIGIFLKRKFDTGDLNPASDKNIFFQGATDITSKIAGQSESPGTGIYALGAKLNPLNWFRTNADTIDFSGPVTAGERALNQSPPLNPKTDYGPL